VIRPNIVFCSILDAKCDQRFAVAENSLICYSEENVYEVTSKCGHFIQLPVSLCIQKETRPSLPKRLQIGLSVLKRLAIKHISGPFWAHHVVSTLFQMPCAVVIAFVSFT